MTFAVGAELARLTSETVLQRRSRSNSDQGLVLLRGPGHRGEPIPDAKDLGEIAHERRREPHHLLPVRDLPERVAAVERLNPYESRRLQRLPVHQSRPGRYALTRHLVGDREIGHGPEAL